MRVKWTKTQLIQTSEKGFEFHDDLEFTSESFEHLDRDEVEYYVNTFKPYDKAGAYGIQDSAKVFVDHIDGDLDNVIGLPVYRVKDALNNSNLGNITELTEEIECLKKVTRYYCPTCKNTVNHIECRTMEEVEIFKQEFKQGVYENEAKESLVVSRNTWLW